jgi:hypothetical protein
MSASQPSYPAPPSVTTGAPGRPSSRPVAPGVVSAPNAPVAPVSSPAGPTPSGAPNQGPAGAPPRPLLGDVPTRPDTTTKVGLGGHNTPPAPTGPPPPAAVQQPGGGVTLQLNRIPARRDYVGLLPGTGISTPYGHATLGSDGQPVIQFASPQHEARYRQDEAGYAAKFGPTPLSGMPGAPQPNIRLGQHAYNPFTGGFLSPE